MGKIKQLYYRWKMMSNYSNYNFETIPEIVSKYGNFDDFNYYTESDMENGLALSPDQLYVFKNETEYEVYYGNIKIAISKKFNDQHVVRMYIKKENDFWDFRVDGGGKPINPNNTLEIYLDYDVVVLDDKHCFNTSYKNGSWDEYVYETANEIIDKVNGLIDYNSFNLSYHGKIRHEKMILPVKNEKN